MNLHKYIDYLYTVSPLFYNLQLNFFNGNHFAVLKTKLKNIPQDTIFEIGCGTAPMLNTFKPKKYVGVDIEKKFITLARKTHPQKNYEFYVGDGRNVEIKDNFDIILFSHTTHHLTDKEIRNLLDRVRHYNFKHLVIYDGRPRGILAPLLVKMDYGAAKFRDTKDLALLIDNHYKIEKQETFRSNRPFYEYQLLIISKT